MGLGLGLGGGVDLSLAVGDSSSLSLSSSLSPYPSLSLVSPPLFSVKETRALGRAADAAAASEGPSGPPTLLPVLLVSGSQ